MPPAVVVVTGASRGIGQAFVHLYASRPNTTVIAAVRTPAADAPAPLCAENSKVLTVTGADVSTPEGVQTLSSAVMKTMQEEKSIDLTLINNAGVLVPDSLTGDDMPDEMLRQFKVNALAPMIVTRSILPALKACGAAPNGRARVVNMTSRMGSIADNTSGGYYGYRTSKAALNAASVSLARDLRKDKVEVVLVHPGHIRTKMVGHTGDMDPKECVEKLVKIIDASTLETSGTFWHRDGTVLPW